MQKRKKSFGLTQTNECIVDEGRIDNENNGL
jgi:hypothetical protein